MLDNIKNLWSPSQDGDRMYSIFQSRVEVVIYQAYALLTIPVAASKVAKLFNLYRRDIAKENEEYVGSMAAEIVKINVRYTQCISDWYCMQYTNRKLHCDNLTAIKENPCFLL